MINLDNRYNFVQTPDPEIVDNFYITVDVSKPVEELFGDGIIREARQIVFHGKENARGIERAVSESIHEIELYNDVEFRRGAVLVSLTNGKVVLFGCRIGSMEESEFFILENSYTTIPEPGIPELTMCKTRANYGSQVYYLFTVDITDAMSVVFGDVLQKARQTVFSGWITEDIPKIIENAKAIAHSAVKGQNSLIYGDIELYFSNCKCVRIRGDNLHGVIVNSGMIGGQL